MARQGGGRDREHQLRVGVRSPVARAYATAKEGLVGLTRTAAMELGRFGIRCNAIRPWRSRCQVARVPRAHRRRGGGSWTSRWARHQAMEHRTTVSPRAISPIVVWLCTDAARRRERAHVPRVGGPGLAAERAAAEGHDRARTAAGRSTTSTRVAPRSSCAAHQPLDPRRPPRAAGVPRPRVVMSWRDVVAGCRGGCRRVM